MQIADTFSNGGLPPSSGGGAFLPDIASQLRQQQERQQRILRWRAFASWWYPVVLIILGSALAITLAATLGTTYPLPLFAAFLGLPVFFLLIKRVDFSLLLLAAGTTAIAPKLVTLKSADIYPCQILIAVLFCTLLVQAAFRTHKISLPPLRAFWPQLGLFILAIISNVMIQFTWTHGVPKKLNNNPIIYSEILGIISFTFPLMVYVIVNMIVSVKERYVVYLQRIFILLGIFVALVVLYDFRRIGADIYTFRFSEPHIAWMSLRAIAQLLALTCILAYARFLYATTWRRRIVYLVIVLLSLTTVILTLENSWWVEAFIALIVMTIIYSWRLISFYIVLAIPLLPFLKAEYTKLQTVKSADTARYIIWVDALRVWSKQPILGVGPGNFWVYDQVFTNLPRALRNCNATGLCVAHNGYLQILGEEGPLGLLLFLAFPIVIIGLAALLYRRAHIARKRSRANVFLKFMGWIGLDLVDLPEQRKAKKQRQNYSPGKAVENRLLNRIWAAFSDDARSERHVDRMLALSAIGLTIGSMFSDFFAGGFFIPPRQLSILSEMPQVVTSWIIWALIMYKDQKWRKTCRKAEAAGTRPRAYQMEGENK